MEYRMLGPSGVWVAPLCLGTLNFGDPTPEDKAVRTLDELNPPGTAVANFHNNSGWMKMKIGA